jgi:hypothetical protein
VWDDARIAVLESLGRREEAQQLRWDCFCQTLSIPHLRTHLQHLDDFEDVEVEERALQVAAEHPVTLRGLQFLVEWPALPQAARHVLRHSQEWEGDAYEILSPAAELLSANHPLAATLLLRAMVFSALWMGRAKRHRYAAEQLRSCEQLATRIGNWQGVEDHESFVARLRDIFGAKGSF